VAQAEPSPPTGPNPPLEGLPRPARAMMLKPLQPLPPVLQPGQAQVLP
jgi:hypothetical protein